MSAVYMLDTNICSFIMRERPLVVLQRMQTAVEGQGQIVVSVVTYYEMLLGTIGRKASARHGALVEAFVARVSSILPWERAAAEATARIQKELGAKGMPIGGNDAMIAGHAVSVGCVLVTNNTREFRRVENLRVEDWAVA
ncbi:MAG TPA: type II toxin-antitoxin system VapC family toxin [Roseiarcus sp.]|jgi:tRNA(fMet)-specific endonuclease VapC